MTLEWCRPEVEGWLEIKLTTGRYSAVFAEALARHMMLRTLDVFAIYDEIELLESAPGTPSRSTKSAALFREAVLGGLWHKHYSTPAFLMKNLINHWTNR